MSTPTVACVMLANGREAMVQRAIKSFQAQTYEHKRLVIWNTGHAGPFLTDEQHGRGTWEPCIIGAVEGMSVGELRNSANRWAVESLDGIDLIAHWDSDDWSHPQRIAEQVALLEQTGADLTGYRDAIFWDTREYVAKLDRPRLANTSEPGSESNYVGTSVQGRVNEAWLYRSEHPKMVIGASMMYRRQLWERCPFEDIPTAEDYRFWLQAVKDPAKVAAASSFTGDCTDVVFNEPRMVCELHGSNTSPAYENMHSSSWWRAAEYDGYAKGVMAL